MNAAGRDALIAAGLRGHPQVHGTMHQQMTPAYVFNLPFSRLFRRATWRGGECAAGVLHLGVHATRAEAVACLRIKCGWRALYAVSIEDFERMVSLNDTERLDFIGIARKLETSESVEDRALVLKREQGS